MSISWNEVYDANNEPSGSQIIEFVKTPLWDDLDSYLKQKYNIQPQLFYSNCSMDKGYWKGWNVKYKKSGKSLCTLYPKDGYFLALIPVSAKDLDEAEILIKLCDKYTQDLYHQTKSGNTGKSLAMEVKNKKILADLKSLVALRC